jgi:hypothetical protein
MSLFELLIGPDYLSLPAPVRKVHDDCIQKIFSGTCRVERGSGLIAKMLASVLSLPSTGGNVSIKVRIERNKSTEIWTREFAGQPMRSILGEHNGCLEEVLGPVRFRFILRATEQQIVWEVSEVKVLGIPLPTAWFAAVGAREWAEAGKYRFDVRAELPVVGLLVSYRGFLSIDA